jgi:PAS domain S-box-containing protein
MNKATILIVEDDGILATYLENILTGLGYSVLGPVASGEEAVAYPGGRNINLVLMDIELAGAMDGITAAERICRTTEIPIVFMTGFSQDALLEKAKIASPYGYLIKPVSERELAATVQMTLHRHAADRRLKESQAALEKSEAKYRNLFESLPIGIFRTGLDGKILEGNREMVKIVGCASPEEVLQTFKKLPGQLYVDPCRRKEFLSLLRKHGEVTDFEFMARKKSGELSWLSVNAGIKLDDGSGKPVIEGFAQDITERKRAQEALRLVAESGTAPGQDIFRFLVRQLAVSLEKRYSLLVAIDEGDPTSAHTVAVWQDGGFAENFSYSLCGTPCGNVAMQGVCFYPRDIQNLYPGDHLLSLMEAESYWGIPLRDAAGNTFGLLAVLDDKPMEETPQALSLLTSFAARAAGELERRRTEEKYQTLFREMLDGFAVHEIVCDAGGSPVDYRFLAVNPAFERLTGMQGAEIIGKSVREVMPHIEKHWIDTYGKVALTGEAVHFENYSRDLDRYFEVTAFRPEMNRFACILEDITERKRSEEERAKLQEQLYQAQKMEDIGRLTGGVAHDFNNHLTAIIGCSQILLKKLPADSELRHFAEMVCSAGEKAAVLTRSLLTFSRKQPFEKRPVDVQVILTNMSKLLRRLIGEDIELLIEQSQTPLFVNADSGQIEQVLMNLATNARDAMPDGGTICVKTEFKRMDQEFMSVYGRGKPGDYAVVSFCDTGEGIPAECMQRVFEPFYTSKDPGKGTGLGLSIVHGIIQQHGGHILLESTPEHGTIFTIFLPLLARHRHADICREQEIFKGGAETILVCEDDPPVRRLVRLVLEDAGYEVLEAVDGEDAVESYHRLRNKIHLVILDVVMPKKSGVAAYAEILGLKPDVRVLFTSGYTPETINRSGVFDMNLPFIPKPIIPGMLLKKVREALDGEEGSLV